MGRWRAWLEWLLACAARDPAIARTGRWLNGVLLGMIGVLSLLVAVGFVWPGSGAGHIQPVVALAVGTQVVAYAAARRGQVEAAAGVCLLIYVVGVLSALYWGNLTFPVVIIAPLYMLGTIPFAGVFLTWRAGFALMLFEIAHSIWFYAYCPLPVLVDYRLAHPGPLTWLAATVPILITMTGVMAWLSNRVVADWTRELERVVAARTAELVQAKATVETLYQVGRSLAVIEDLDAMLRAVAANAAAALPADRVLVITLDEAARAVTHFVEAGPGTGPTVPLSYAELADGLTGWVLRTGRPAFSPAGVPDPRESAVVQARRAATACGAVMVAPLIYREQRFGSITAINRPNDRAFTAADLAFLEELAQQAATAIAQALQFAQARTLASTDALTGLLNRRSFLAAGAAEMARGRETGRAPALLALDLDHFKTINDRYGHLVGDAVLQEVSTRMRVCLREGDLLGRLGGEEFMALLPATDGAVAQSVAEQVRQAVATALPTPVGPLRVTVSIGVALDAADLPMLLARADTALYAAKQAGRDRVVVQGHGGAVLLAAGGRPA